ncbi:phage virion morphogenesis protein [Thermomonas sp. S9]|uniref:phage virion morphogenesis protein n=1 Tax=Thermomonas sp. S9 TaxID=2885203 RepID=UPI00216B1D8A|nr:phage virion morphogenesis protein [Thermomonas sp. S9]MCR6497375.1 phage virion morphogenesis protein [Thermomonas sp. S9]
MIRIDIDDREVRQALERLQQRVSDLTPAMREIAMELEARALNRFETERDPAGRPWQPLSPVTLARKKGRGGILYQTGDLLDSATSRAGRDVAEVGFGLRYAVFHEYGTKKMPRRGLLMADPEARTLGEDDKRAILEIIGEHLSGG